MDRSQGDQAMNHIPETGKMVETPRTDAAKQISTTQTK
jgi:hypothetical protein